MDKILLSQLTKGFADIKNDCYITLVTSDSRTVTENSVFLAIKGEKVNGEDYASKAVENGAKLVISENYLESIPKELQCTVENILDASIKMGENFRAMYEIDIIGVTGSVGKTTTKDFIYTAISPFVKTVRSKGNQNNELGMPNTIYTFTNQDKMAILEMGMTHFNDVHKLSTAAKPKAGVITCIGVSHLQQMKTQENILKAKLEICDGIDGDGILVLNGDDKFLVNAKVSNPKNVYYVGINNKNADVIATDIVIKGESTSFIIGDKNNINIPCIIPTVGTHNVLNALLAYCVATRLGFDPVKTANNLKDYVPSGMRQKVVKLNGITFIEDCYNASPDSMKAAINTLQSLKQTRTIAVLGDMLELGEQSNVMHKDIGEYAKSKGVDIVLCYGEESKLVCEGYSENAVHFNSKEQLAKHLLKIIKQDDTVIFKASRGMAFEDIISMVYENQE